MLVRIICIMLNWVFMNVIKDNKMTKKSTTLKILKLIVISVVSISVMYGFYAFLSGKQTFSYPTATTLSFDEFNQYIKDYGKNEIFCEITLGSREEGNRIKHCYDKKQNMLIYLKSNELKNSKAQDEK